MTDATVPPSVPYRVGVVGVGNRASIAAHALEAGVPVVITAIAEPTTAGLRRARELFGPDPQAFSDHRAMIAAGLIDAAVVTSPDDTHAEIAIDLLRAGIAVYLEKPMAISLEDCDRILETAAASGAVLYVGHNFRHAAVVRLMNEIVRRGEIGEVKAVWVRHFVGNGGDYYFKDWHADRRRVNSLLLQKASHDIDVIHMLAGADTTRVVGMGSLSVYGGIDDRSPHPDQVANDWFSFDNWPPLTQTGLNDVVDVEDISLVMMTLEHGVMASYEQCHFTPDYWRNYTVIGTEGRLENVGDTAGGVVKVWTTRREWAAGGDVEYPIPGERSGHEDADRITMREFVRYAALGEAPTLSPLAARAAVATGALATASLRGGSVPIDVPPLSDAVRRRFAPATEQEA